VGCSGICIDLDSAPEENERFLEFVLVQPEHAEPMDGIEMIGIDRQGSGIQNFGLGIAALPMLERCALYQILDRTRQSEPIRWKAFRWRPKKLNDPVSRIAL
jgi:hypothetical protein